MNPDTLLHRQIHPAWVQDGRVTSQAFKPTPKDSGLLSVYDGDLISAADAWIHFTGTLKLCSVGCVAVCVAECTEQNLPTRPDPTPYPSHVLIDFTGCDSKKAIERAAKRLSGHAARRGWQYGGDVA